MKILSVFLGRPFFTAIASVLLWTASPGLSLAASWTLTGQLSAHDPTVIKEGDTWWCFTTGAGLRVKSSPDGLNWQQKSPLFDTELPWWRKYAPSMRNRDVWAPDVRKFGNRTWCFYCVSEFGKNNSAIGLQSCTTIAAGNWREDGLILSSRSGADGYNALDPNLAIDAAGNPWLAFGSWFDGIHVVALDASTMKPSGSMHAIALRKNGIEAANIVYANGYYYLFVSIDRCCAGINSTYKIAYGRSVQITGPFIDKSGVDMLKGGGTLLEEGGDRWKGPGGQYVYQLGNEWLLAKHAYDAENSGIPALRIDDLYWDTSKWPTFKVPKE